jgi:eukaryotic-like serine/threonine-protein kinase
LASGMESDGVPCSPARVMGYDVIDELGRGAGSILYAVRDPDTQQTFALKYVQPQTERDQRFVEQLLIEYEAGQKVNHIGLRRSIGLKLSKTLLRRVTQAALVLELFDGRPLERRPHTRKVGVVDVFLRVAEALEALHAAGYVHCDLKPTNILVADDGKVKVIDLGQACPIGTRKPRIQGTPDYIAPEQVRCQPVTPATDVYNLGASLYWCLTGQNLPTLYTLKRGENSFLLDHKVVTPAELNPKVPAQLSELVMDCVRTSSAKRPQSMRDVILRLEIARHILQKQRERRRASRRDDMVIA